MSDQDQKLFMASQKGNLEEVKTLAGSGANVNYTRPNDFDNTPLIKAVIQGHAEVVRHLLTAPAVNVNLPNRHGKTALAFAAERKDDAILQLLLADPRTDAKVGSPLTAAVVGGNEKNVRTLLALPNLDVNARGEKTPITALFAAVSKGKEQLGRLLLADPRLVPDLDAVQESLTTLTLTSELISHPQVDTSKLRRPLAFLVAAQQNEPAKEAALRILLRDERVNVNEVDPHNETALWFACAMRMASPRVVKLILASGRADATIAKTGSHPGNELENGTTAVDAAVLGGDQTKKEIMEAYLKDKDQAIATFRKELNW